MTHMRIASRLIGAFLLVALIGAAIGAYAINNMRRLNEADTALYERETYGLSLVKEANVQRYGALLALRDALLSTSDETRAHAVDRAEKARFLTQILLDQAMDLVKDDPHRLLAFGAVHEAWGQDQQHFERVKEAILANEWRDEAQSQPGRDHRSAELNQTLDATMTDLNHSFELAAKAVADNNTALYETSRNVTLALIGLGVMVGVGFGTLISQGVTRPLEQAVASAKKMSSGDMSQAFAAHGRDEVAQLMQALEHMRLQLSGIVGRIRVAAESVAATSVEIAHGNHDLADRTESQLKSLDETASSMKQLGATVALNADHALAANRLAQQASAVAQEGGAVVKEVVSTMKAINDGSRKVADIIGLIDSIAFQTNILALNAAVEAARAGEQGRGFAVVAGEVRGLAQRTATAAKEIKGLITDSVSRVEQGSALADRAGKTMLEVVDGIQRVNDLMSDISHSSQAQSHGIGKMNEAVENMDQSTRQNALLVERITNAVKHLRTQSDDLVQAVASFGLADISSRQLRVETTATAAE